MAKPGDFHVGVIDFFAIVLPGALLTALFAGIPAIREAPPLPQLVAAGAAAQWIAFALASYAFGHFLFLLSAPLDHSLYDPYRTWRWPDRTGCAYLQATELRCRYFDNGRPAEDDDPMNTFNWCKSFLMLRAADALADVNRYEADSKFFRSLVVVLPIAAALLAFQYRQLGMAAAALALGLVSFICYAHRRRKSTEWAYRYVLVLNRLPQVARAED